MFFFLVCLFRILRRRGRKQDARSNGRGWGGGCRDQIRSLWRIIEVCEEVSEWCRHTQVSGFCSDSPAVTWNWEGVQVPRSYSDSSRSHHDDLYSLYIYIYIWSVSLLSILSSARKSLTYFWCVCLFSVFSVYVVNIK